MRVWTAYDVRYLRSLKIGSGDQPSPLPRFQVEPGAGGEYQVIDWRWPRKVFVHTVVAAHPLARAYAELKAKELNEECEKQA